MERSVKEGKRGGKGRYLRTSWSGTRAIFSTFPKHQLKARYLRTSVICSRSSHFFANVTQIATIYISHANRKVTFPKAINVWEFGPMIQIILTPVPKRTVFFACTFSGSRRFWSLRPAGVGCSTPHVLELVMPPWRGRKCVTCADSEGCKQIHTCEQACNTKKNNCALV